MNLNLGKKEKQKDQDEAVQDVVLENEGKNDDNGGESKLIGILDKIGVNEHTRNLIKRDKKQIIRCACFILGTILVVNIAKGASNMFKEMLVEENKAYNDLNNEVDQYQSSNRLYTGVEGTLQTSTNTEVKWVGDKADLGRWMADESYFWNWISPAVNYDNATEYATMRASYTEQVGHCLFTDQFLAPYDPAQDLAQEKKVGNGDGELSPEEINEISNKYNCTSNKKNFLTYPIKKMDDGSYSYLALVPIRRSGSKTSTMIAFTYTVVHESKADGTEAIIINNLECWPPDAKNPMTIEQN